MKWTTPVLNQRSLAEIRHGEADAKKRRKLENASREESGRSVWRPVENVNNENVVDDALNFNHFVYLLVFLNSFKIVANKFGKLSFGYM